MGVRERIRLCQADPVDTIELVFFFSFTDVVKPNRH